MCEQKKAVVQVSLEAPSTEVTLSGKGNERKEKREGGGAEEVGRRKLRRVKRREEEEEKTKKKKQPIIKPTKSIFSPFLFPEKLRDLNQRLNAFFLFCEKEEE